MWWDVNAVGVERGSVPAGLELLDCVVRESLLDFVVCDSLGDCSLFRKIFVEGSARSAHIEHRVPLHIDRQWFIPQAQGPEFRAFLTFHIKTS